MKLKGHLVGATIKLDSVPINLPEEVEVCLKPWGKSKTNPQLGYYYSEYIPKAIIGFYETCGEKMTKELAHITLKTMFFFSIVQNKSTGEVLHIPMSLSKASAEEMSNYMSQVENWLWHYCQITVDEPRRNNVRP